MIKINNPKQTKYGRVHLLDIKKNSQQMNVGEIRITRTTPNYELVEVYFYYPNGGEVYLKSFPSLSQAKLYVNKVFKSKKTLIETVMETSKNNLLDTLINF